MDKISYLPAWECSPVWNLIRIWGTGLGGNDDVDLRCSVCYLIVLPFPFPRSCILVGDFFTCRARRGWLTSQLFVALSASASVQAHCFMYGVSYCCHPVSCLSDVSLLSKVNSQFLTAYRKLRTVYMPHASRVSVVFVRLSCWGVPGCSMYVQG